MINNQLTSVFDVTVFKFELKEGKARIHGQKVQVHKNTSANCDMLCGLQRTLQVDKFNAIVFKVPVLNIETKRYHPAKIIAL